MTTCEAALQTRAAAAPAPARLRDVELEGVAHGVTMEEMGCEDGEGRARTSVLEMGYIDIGF